MYKYKGIIFNLKLGDITKENTDAIVNAANNTLLGGGGVDGAIHRAGGPEILEQCKKIGGCPTGEARITVGGNLPSKYVIHTVGPIYEEKSLKVERKLYNAYFNSLKLANEYGIEDISFPSISTGVYGYPIKDAVKVATRSVIDFIDEENETLKEINFILFSEEDFKVYESYFNSIFS